MLGRLREKHAVVTWKFWGLFSICLDRETKIRTYVYAP